MKEEEFSPACVFILGFTRLTSDLSLRVQRRKSAIPVGLTALYPTQACASCGLVSSRAQAALSGSCLQ